jgi:hypothetical protein
MGKRHKLIRVSEDKLRSDAKDEILDLIHSRFVSGRDTSLQDIQDVFQQPPYSLSEGSVINYLNELCEQRKLSTWKIKNRRFYGPPKIPLPIKIGIASISIIFILTILIDSFIPHELIARYIYFGYIKEAKDVSVIPIAIYSIMLTVIFTFFWYLFEKRKEKTNENNRKLFK